MTAGAMSYPFIVVWIAMASVRVWLLLAGVPVAQTGAYRIYTTYRQYFGANQQSNCCS
jgi:hypothetical protein